MQRRVMAPLLAALVLCLAGVASAVVAVPCKQTVAGNKAEYKYQCTFCNPTSYALRFPRLNCTNFQNSTRRNNIGLTSPFCYITQFNRIDPQTCTDFSFRTPLTSATVNITFDDSAPGSTIQTPTSGTNFLKCFLEKQTFFRTSSPDWFEYDCYLRNGGLKFPRYVLPCSFPTLYETEGRFEKLKNGSCIVRMTLNFNDVYKFGFTVPPGNYLLGIAAPFPPPPSPPSPRPPPSPPPAP